MKGSGSGVKLGINSVVKGRVWAISLSVASHNNQRNGERDQPRWSQGTLFGEALSSRRFQGKKGVGSS